MPSPVRPSDFAATVPGQSSDFCTKFKLVFLTLPNLIASYFGWALASNGAISDDFKAEVNPFSAGDLKVTFSSLTPSGWLRCEGQTVNRITYAALFTAIGTTYGAGDGSTTFNIPDCRNRVTLGVSSTKALGVTGGEETHVLTIAELAAHTHNVEYAGNRANYTSANPIVTGIGAGGGSFSASSSTGSGTAHNNLQPYIAAYVLIKT